MKIAILLPDSLGVATLQRARTLIRLLRKATPLMGGPVELAVGLPLLPEAEWRAHEAMLKGKEEGVIVRHMQWEKVPSDHAQRMFVSFDVSFELSGIDEVSIPRDWGWNFSDCDFWINFADPALGAVYPLKPIAHYCPDLAVRIAPFAFSESIHDPYWKKQMAAFRMWRQRALVLTSDPYTVHDLVSYAGIRRDAVIGVPELLDDSPELASSSKHNEKQIVWWMEPNDLHSIQAAAEGLRIYLAEGGAMQPVIATESNLEIFEKSSLSKAIADIPIELRKLLANIPKERLRSHDGLMRLLGRSGILWSNCIAGGEGYAIRCANRANMHFLGMDFPLQKDLVAKLRLPTILYKSQSPIEIASALHAMERMVEKQPTRSVEPPQSDIMRAMEYSLMLDRLSEMTCA